MSFTIQSLPPDAITDSATQPDAVALSTEEIRNCFPTRVSMVVNGQESIVLEDAPAIGVLVEIAEAWLQLMRGAQAAEVIDFYGEYKLVLRETEGFVECESEFSGERCRVPIETFVAAARQWSGAVFAAVEQRHADIGRNASYARLKAFILGAWDDGVKR